MKAIRFEELPLARNTQSQPARVEQGVERLGWLMDDLFRVPVLGWRFGLDALIGLATLMAQADNVERAVEVLTLVRGAARIDRRPRDHALPIS